MLALSQRTGLRAARTSARGARGAARRRSSRCRSSPPSRSCRRRGTRRRASPGRARSARRGWRSSSRTARPASPTVPSGRRGRASGGIAGPRPARSRRPAPAARGRGRTGAQRREVVLAAVEDQGTVTARRIAATTAIGISDRCGGAPEPLRSPPGSRRLGDRVPLGESRDDAHCPALPSPNGFAGRAIASYASRSSSRWDAAAWTSSGSVPTRRATPASIASGRSVVSRRTRTGFPSDGASSWRPPESVRTGIAARHRRDEGEVVERLAEVHAVEVLEHVTDDGLHGGIRVHRENDLRVAAGGQQRERLARSRASTGRGSRGDGA